MSNILHLSIGKPLLMILVGACLVILGLVNSSEQNSKESIEDNSTSVLGSQAQTNNRKVTQVIKASPIARLKTVKPSDKSLRLTTYIFAVIKGDQRSEFINKFSNGKNDLALAVNNLALLLDSKPELFTAVDKAITQDIANKKAQAENDAVLEYHQKEYERLKAQNDSLNVSSNNNAYSYGAQNTNAKSGSSYVASSPQTAKTLINILGSADSYTRYGDTVLGSDGSSYTQYGDTVLSSDGKSYTRYGDTILGSDGSSSTKYGNTTLQNDGRGFTQYGNTTLGSDGSSYTQYGDTTLANPSY